jgi:hypothetical protein
VVPKASAQRRRRLAAGPDLRGALLAMAYLAQYPMTAALLRASRIGAAVLPLRQVRCPPRSARGCLNTERSIDTHQMPRVHAA